MFKNKSVWWVIGIVVLIAALLMVGRITKRPAQTVSDPSTLPGLQTGNVPWPPEIEHLALRLSQDGLPALSAEGTVLHIHQHIDIFIDGKPIVVPANIGISQAAGFISPIHVHDTTGVIHEESPTIQDFSLGQFFDIWGVKFTKDCIGGYCSADAKLLKVYSNGTLVEGDPRKLKLEAHQEIAITYGTNEEAPTSTPSSFAFPIGE
jgi:hypothetical protein